MKFDWSEWIPARMKAGSAYTPGEQRNTGDWIKLNTNEFPFPPSPDVPTAIAEASQYLRFYPNPTGQALREELGDHHQIDAGAVVLFNGCDDALNCCIRGLVDPGDRVACLNPSYSLYSTLLKNHGAEFVGVEYEQEFDFPFKRLVSCDARMFLLTSPNAPSGRAFKREELIRLLEEKEAIFVLDETYADFSNWSAIPDIQKYPNLIVVRSFSKTYGLAGIRIGYAVAHPDIIPTLHQIRDVYNVNRLSQAGAIAALQDSDYYLEKHRILMETKRDFVAFVGDELKWDQYPSATNFVFIFPEMFQGARGVSVAENLFSFLVENRVLVRYFSTHPLIESGLRISIGTPTEMETVKNLLRKWAHKE